MNESHKELVKKVGSAIWKTVWTISKYLLKAFLWLVWFSFAMFIGLMVVSFCSAFGIRVPDFPPMPDFPPKPDPPKPPKTPDDIKNKKPQEIIQECPISPPETPIEEKILQKLMNAPKGKLISQILTEEEIEILFIMILRGFGISV